VQARPKCGDRCMPRLLDAELPYADSLGLSSELAQD